MTTVSFKSTDSLNKWYSTREGQLLYYTQLLVIVTLPFHFLISSYAIGLLLIVFLYTLARSRTFRGEIKLAIERNKIAKLMIFLFLFYIASALIHFSAYENFDVALVALEKNLSFLIFPILFANIRTYSNKKITSIFIVFIISVLLSTLIALMAGAFSTLMSGSLYFYDADKQSIYNNFMYHRLGSYVGMHAVYFAEYVLFGLILWSIYSRSRFNVWKIRKKVFSIIIGIYLICLIFLLKSAVILTSLLLLVIIFTIYYLHKWRDKISVTVKIIIGASAIFFVLVLSYGIINKIGDKASYFAYDFSEPGGGQWNSINLRLAKWQVAKMAISDHWFWGVGPGNTIGVLDDYYKKVGFDYALRLQFNPHNQFLHTFLTYGIIGLVLLVYIFWISFKTSLQKRDAAMFLFTFSFLFFSMSESTLAVNKGIVFFALFLSVFSNLSQKLSKYFSEESE